jgi:hypothetical protein
MPPSAPASEPRTDVVGKVLARVSWPRQPPATPSKTQVKVRGVWIHRDFPNNIRTGRKGHPLAVRSGLPSRWSMHATARVLSQHTLMGFSARTDTVGEFGCAALWRRRDLLAPRGGQYGRVPRGSRSCHKEFANSICAGREVHPTGRFRCSSLATEDAYDHEDLRPSGVVRRSGWPARPARALPRALEAEGLVAPSDGRGLGAGRAWPGACPRRSDASSRGARHDGGRSRGGFRWWRPCLARRAAEDAPGRVG